MEIKDRSIVSRVVIFRFRGLFSLRQVFFTWLLRMGGRKRKFLFFHFDFWSFLNLFFWYFLFWVNNWRQIQLLISVILLPFLIIMREQLIQHILLLFQLHSLLFEFDFLFSEFNFIFFEFNFLFSEFDMLFFDSFPFTHLLLMRKQ